MSLELRAQGLNKSFKGRAVVKDVEVAVEPGQVVGLLGPNGAGKTTTFKMILGLLAQDSGTVTFGTTLDGLPLHRRARRGLGYLPQGASVFGGLNVEENLLVLLEALRKPDPSKRSLELLKRFGLEKLAKQKASTLSGGERRRLEFARALCSDPKILLVDEPFAGVDPIAMSEISSSITALAQGGVGVLLTDHSVREALSVCDLIYLLVDGVVVDSGTGDQIEKSQKARSLYLGEGFSVD